MSRKVIISIILLAVIILTAIDLVGAVVPFVGDPAACAWADDRDRPIDRDAPLNV
jgi:ABC-type xylose transport system permease subunit